MLFRATLVSALLGAIIGAGCQTKPTVMDKVRTNTVIAMVDDEGSTDQFLMKVFAKTNSIVIRDGRGGELDGMLRTLDYLAEHPDKTIVIDGPCYSACTLLLSQSNNVVFTERAKFFFHSASLRYSDGTSELSDAGNAKMLERFNAKTREWIETNHAYNSTQFTAMSLSVVKRLYPTMYVSSSEFPDYEIGETLQLD